MGQVLALRQETSGTLFDLPPLSPSQRDCTDEGCIAQARHELHRALDFGTDADRAAWVERWGEALVSGALAGVDAHERWQAAEDREEPDYPDGDDVDTARVDDAIGDAGEHVDRALSVLDGKAPDLASVREELVAAKRDLERADQELDKL